MPTGSTLRQNSWKLAANLCDERFWTGEYYLQRYPPGEGIVGDEFQQGAEYLITFSPGHHIGALSLLDEPVAVLEGEPRIARRPGSQPFVQGPGLG